MTDLRKICSKLLCHLKQFDYSDDDIFAVHLAYEEAIVNAVKHGNGDDINKSVIIEFEVGTEKTMITITDEGVGFEPGNVDDPRKGENIYKIGGRGVLLIKSYMDGVEYNANGNSITMTKKSSKPVKQGEINKA